MKIAAIAPTEIPSRRANTIQVMKMAQAMVALGHEVRLAAPHAPGVDQGEDHQTWGRMHGMDIAWEDYARHYGLSRRFPIERLIAKPGLRRYDFSLSAVNWARRWNPDLVYTRLPQAAVLAARLGSATILEIHDMPQGFAGPLLFRLFLKSRGACRLVVITHALARDLHRRFGGRVSAPMMVVAPDGVDLERYENLPSPEAARSALNRLQPDGYSLNLKRFTAGYSGHLYPGRGADFMIEIAARLPDIDFLFVGGEAQQVSSLRTKIIDRKLTNVFLTGFVPNSELPLYQAACDALLMPYQSQVSASSGGDISRYLSPLKMFEYLASGRPILSSDLPVFMEVLNQHNAILLPAAEVESWTRSLRDLQNDPKKRVRMSVQARQDALKYTWERRAELILEGLVTRD